MQEHAVGLFFLAGVNCDFEWGTLLLKLLKAKTEIICTLLGQQGEAQYLICVWILQSDNKQCLVPN